jgi:hypothetical protein
LQLYQGFEKKDAEIQQLKRTVTALENNLHELSVEAKK